jgi:hypothetical protein
MAEMLPSVAVAETCADVFGPYAAIWLFDLSMVNDALLNQSCLIAGLLLRVEKPIK